MTETNTTTDTTTTDTTTTDAGQVGGQADTRPETTVDDTGDAEPSGNSEAAKYRRQLRDTEAQRDALAERLTGYQKRECESVVADLLDVPADLWDVAGLDVADMYADDGTVDADKVRFAAGTLAEMRPRLAKPPTPQASWGQGSGGIAPAGGGEVSWSDVIKR
ncbi:hypothetical protein [Mycobacterium avium]|uniref:hypothetical protein n=1 Tax=Mycobacterium avium TaxID=1764 RepID=UPI001CC5E88F|nr:hypothetical protein [Mycobacterium avium]MBZ4620991.1 hypothetical protein [Mycobacterium avium subsp. hominissuis]